MGDPPRRGPERTSSGPRKEERTPRGSPEEAAGDSPPGGSRVGGPERVGQRPVSGPRDPLGRGYSHLRGRSYFLLLLEGELYESGDRRCPKWFVGLASSERFFLEGKEIIFASGPLREVLEFLREPCLGGRRVYGDVPLPVSFRRVKWVSKDGARTRIVPRARKDSEAPEWAVLYRLLATGSPGRGLVNLDLGREKSFAEELLTKLGSGEEEREQGEEPERFGSYLSLRTTL